MPSSELEDSKGLDDKPRGILKNPPSLAAYNAEFSQVDHEQVILNTNINAAQHGDHSKLNIRRLSSNSNDGKLSSTVADNSQDDENGPRLKWDEVNLYLTEQDRTAKMKITEPKTPYQHSFEPIDDDEDELEVEDVPGLSLGEPAEEVPHHEPKVTVDHDRFKGSSDDDEEGHDDEKHRRFQELRKKHYEMKSALQLGHELEDKEEDDGDNDNDTANNDDS
ncbi:hypothetical protein V1514DRAFT_339211 [Lipomyces japonicus]|uniref:uncharacterized protein n=1 Tax=Lipomyces japonicus TaxID=56871 RepID=UPI0034CD7D78